MYMLLSVCKWNQNSLKITWGIRSCLPTLAFLLWYSIIQKLISPVEAILFVNVRLFHASWCQHGAASPSCTVCLYPSLGMLLKQTGIQDVHMIKVILSQTGSSTTQCLCDGVTLMQLTAIHWACSLSVLAKWWSGLVERLSSRSKTSLSLIPHWVRKGEGGGVAMRYSVSARLVYLTIGIGEVQSGRLWERSVRGILRFPQALLFGIAVNSGWAGLGSP